MEKKIVGNMTLCDMVEEMIAFEYSDFMKDTFEPIGKVSSGAIKAYNEALEDMKKLDKAEFIRKYLSKVHEIEKIFESDKTLNQEQIEFYSDYNNAIVGVFGENSSKVFLFGI